MNIKLHTKYPSVADLERKAKKRIPHFAWEYLDSGTGSEYCLKRNREAFARASMVPRSMQGEFVPDLRTTMFGHEYAAPIGIAPVGLTGLMWPRAEKLLAKTAARYRIPFTLSTVATETPEMIGPTCRGMGWFQLYPPKQKTIRSDLLRRARAAGFTTLLVTADVPTSSRRERQIRAGVSVPPKTTLRTAFNAAICPVWLKESLLCGLPRFKTLETYLDNKDMQNMVSFIGKEFGGTLDWDYLAELKQEWDGPVVLKGVLSVEQARQAIDAGLDGIVVSNHGGRQFDGAPASLAVLPDIKAAVGNNINVLFDSGVRSGLDIAHALSRGADFVLLGRAFMFGVGALGQAGGDHVAEILLEDLKNNMTQLGCKSPSQLKDRLFGA